MTKTKAKDEQVERLADLAQSFEMTINKQILAVGEQAMDDGTEDPALPFMLACAALTGAIRASVKVIYAFDVATGEKPDADKAREFLTDICVECIKDATGNMNQFDKIFK